MHPSVEKLLKVQSVDSEMRFLREAKRLRPLELQDDQKRVAQSETALGALGEETKSLRMEIDRGEMQIKAADGEIAKLNIALNGAKTNQEYAVLKAQIEKAREERSELEERVLEQIGELEGLGRRKEELEKTLADRRRILERKAAEVEDVIRGLEGQIDELDERRRTLSAEVDPEHLGFYDRVLAHHGDRAVSLVEDRTCQGCHMTLTPQEISVLMMGQEIVQCRNCSRLLYLE